MTTGNLIAIIVGLLIVLAILWFMTRSRRSGAGAEAHRSEHQRTGADIPPAGPDHDRVTASAGVATAAAHAGLHSGAQSGAPADVRSDAQSGGPAGGQADAQPRAPADATTGTDPGVCGSIAAGTAAAAAGTAAAAAHLGNKARDGAASATGGTDNEPALGATGSFAAPDVPLTHTEGDLRSQGGDDPYDETYDETARIGDDDLVFAQRTSGAPGSFAAPDIPLSSTEGDLRSQGGDGASEDAERGGEAMTERPRFDPSIDGHPVPGDSAATPSSASPAPDAQISAAQANPPVDKEGGGFDGAQGGVGTMRSPDMSSLASAGPALTGGFTVDTANPLHDVREMLKILNLRESEALRLDLSSDEFERLRRGDRGDMDDDRITIVAERLRRMIR